MSQNQVDDCDKTTSIKFNSDNTFIENTFVTVSGQCVSDGVSSATWRIIRHHN